MEIIKEEKESSQTILFIHGTSFGSWCWEEYFIPFFQRQGYGTCTFSFRGHGNSWGKGDINKFGLNEYIEDCLQVIRICVVLLELLHRNPELADKIILLSPATYRGMLGEYFKFSFKYIKLRGISGVYFTNRIDEEVMNSYRSKFVRVSKKISRQLLKPIKLPLLLREKCILIIGSHGDMGVSESLICRIGKELKAKTIFFPDMCHVLMLDPDWRKVAVEILDFLNKNV